jgi:precorrin-6A/cobalt-precorrin-6A reductase
VVGIPRADADDQQPATILVLGGTAEARELAAALDARGARVVSSLAGRVARPRLPVGEVRIGGFGGPEALARWLRAHAVRAVIDATHPFAERISASARRACPAAGVPLLRLERAPWRPRPGDDWHRVADLAAAAALAPQLGRRALLTTGRQGLAAFAAVEGVWFLVRCVEAPAPPLPRDHVLLLDRGPYTLEGELALVDRHRIDLVITKDSGGPLTQAKLDAARERGLPVIVVERPPRPAVRTVTSVAAAVDWAHPG